MPSEVSSVADDERFWSHSRSFFATSDDDRTRCVAEEIGPPRWPLVMLNRHCPGCCLSGWCNIWISNGNAKVLWQPICVQISTCRWFAIWLCLLNQWPVPVGSWRVSLCFFTFLFFFFFLNWTWFRTGIHILIERRLEFNVGLAGRRKKPFAGFELVVSSSHTLCSRRGRIRAFCFSSAFSSNCHLRSRVVANCWRWIMTIHKQWNSLSLSAFFCCTHLQLFSSLQFVEFLLNFSVWKHFYTF